MKSHTDHRLMYLGFFVVMTEAVLFFVFAVAGGFRHSSGLVSFDTIVGLELICAAVLFQRYRSKSETGSQTVRVLRGQHLSLRMRLRSESGKQRA